MPRYKVKRPGFWESRLYSPTGKRSVIHTDKPFPTEKKVEQVPSWMERIPDETPADEKKRKAAESKLKKNSELKAANDLEDINNASFMGEGESAQIQNL